MIIPRVNNEGFDIYSQFLNDRIIFLDDEVNNATSGIVVAELIHLANKSNDAIHIYINSPGGSVIDGLAIIDTMNFIEKSGTEIYTYGIGLQASMSSLLLVSGTKGKRKMLKNSFVMIHSLSQAIRGKLPDLEGELKFANKLKSIITDIYVENTLMTREQIDLIFQSPDFWVDSKEAIEMGIVDGII